MGTTTAKFKLIGPHEGKTLDVNGHSFVDGEYEFQGQPAQITILKKIFAHYGAYEYDSPEAHEAAEAFALAELGRELGTDTGGAGAGTDTGNTNHVESTLTSLGQAGLNTSLPEAAPKPSLGDAIGGLDPENDAHWTSNNLPSLDHLTEVTGAKVSRGEVEAIADGYTRAKARANKA